MKHATAVMVLWIVAVGTMATRPHAYPVAPFEAERIQAIALCKRPPCHLPSLVCKKPPCRQLKQQACGYFYWGTVSSMFSWIWNLYGSSFKCAGGGYGGGGGSAF